MYQVQTGETDYKSAVDIRLDLAHAVELLRVHHHEESAIGTEFLVLGATMLAADGRRVELSVYMTREQAEVFAADFQEGLGLAGDGESQPAEASFRRPMSIDVDVS